MIRYNNQASKQLKNLGYSRAYCAYKLNIKYIDYKYIAQGIARPIEDKTTVFKHLVSNKDNNLKNQDNLIKEARDSYDKIYFFVKSNKDLVKDVTGWSDNTIDTNLSFLYQAIESRDICYIKDNELLVLYFIYIHRLQNLEYDKIELIKYNTKNDVSEVNYKDEEASIKESLGNIKVSEYVKKNFDNVRGFCEKYNFGYSWLYNVDKHSEYSLKDIENIKKILEIPPRKIKKKSRRKSKSTTKTYTVSKILEEPKENKSEFEEYVIKEINELKNQIESIKEELDSTKYIKDSNIATNEKQVELINEVISLRDKLWNSIMRF